MIGALDGASPGDGTDGLVDDGVAADLFPGCRFRLFGQPGGGLLEGPG